MSDFEDNRAPIGNDRARLHSPSSHLAETAVSPHISNSDPHRPPENGSRAGRSDVVNPVSHWPPENGSSVGRTENETDRLPDANPSRRYGVSFQAYGGQGSMYPYLHGGTEFRFNKPSFWPQLYMYPDSHWPMCQAQGREVRGVRRISVLTDRLKNGNSVGRTENETDRLHGGTEFRFNKLMADR